MLIEITKEEAVLLAEALDSHVYWQLSEPNERNDGYTTIEPGENAEVDAAQALEERLREAVRVVVRREIGRRKSVTSFVPVDTEEPALVELLPPPKSLGRVTKTALGAREARAAIRDRAVEWIALEDEPTDLSPTSVAGYVSTALAADLLDVTPEYLARLIVARRRAES